MVICLWPTIFNIWRAGIDRALVARHLDGGRKVYPFGGWARSRRAGNADFLSWSGLRKPGDAFRGRDPEESQFVDGLGNLGDVYAAESNRPDLSQARQAAFRADARGCYAQLYKLAPEQPVAHWKWGIVEEYEGDLQSAKKEFICAIQLEPGFSFARDSLGRLELRTGDVEDGLSDLKKLLDGDPGFLQARLDYGDALNNAGDIDAAEVQYATAVADQPTSADAQFRLANLLFARKKRVDPAAALRGGGCR